jgi:hypothetical protein
MDPKDFLAQWSKQAPAQEDKVHNLLKFMNLARQKKMTMFTDSAMQLKKEHAEHLSSIKGAALEIK